MVEYIATRIDAHARIFSASIHGTAQSARIDANARISRLSIPRPQQRGHAIHIVVRRSHHYLRPRQLDEVRKRVNDARVRLCQKAKTGKTVSVNVGKGWEGGVAIIPEAPDGVGDKQS